jgi:hypothetical protein
LFPELLTNGDFERGRAAWSIAEGATTGSGGTESTVDWKAPGRAGRGLRLSGDGATTTWRSVRSAAIAVTPGSTLSLTGWVHTADLHQEGRQYENQYIGLWFGDAEYRVRPAPDATEGWVPLERIAVVPPGVTEVHVVAFLSVTGAMWLDDLSLVERAPITWDTVQTEHFAFHTLPGAPISDADRAAVEARFTAAESALGHRYAGPILDFYRYPDRELKGALTGDSGNAHFDGHAIHTLWPRDAHEIVHAIAAEIGDPHSPLLGEGLAVALSGSWQGMPVDAWVRRYHRTSLLPGIGALVDDFDSVEERVAYPVAGSFVASLISRRGMQVFLGMYAADGRIRERLSTTYRVPLSDLEADWVRSLDAVDPPPPAVPTGFPELLGLHLVVDLPVVFSPGACGPPGPAVPVFASTAIRLAGAPADVHWQIGALTGSGPLITTTGLPPGPHQLCATAGHTSAALALEVAPAPRTEITVEDIGKGDQPFRSILHTWTADPLTEDHFISSDTVHYEAMWDAAGKPLDLTATHDPAQQLYAYTVRYPEPIPAGALLIRDARGAARDDALQRTPAGGWRWETHHTPDVPDPELHVAIYRLPPGADLPTAPAGMAMRTVDGRAELAQITWIPAWGTVDTAFEYFVH